MDWRRGAARRHYPGAGAAGVTAALCLSQWVQALPANYRVASLAQGGDSARALWARRTTPPARVIKQADGLPSAASVRGLDRLDSNGIGRGTGGEHGEEGSPLFALRADYGDISGVGIDSEQNVLVG